MDSLRTSPRFVICFDDGDRCGSETVHQPDLPGLITRLVNTGFRVADVQPMQSEHDEEVQEREWVASQQGEPAF